MAELKQASYFDSVGLALDAPLLSDLHRHDVDHARSRITVMSFETAILRRLAGRLRLPVPAADGCRGHARGRPRRRR